MKRRSRPVFASAALRRRRCRSVLVDDVAILRSPAYRTVRYPLRNPIDTLMCRGRLSVDVYPLAKSSSAFLSALIWRPIGS